MKQLIILLTFTLASAVTVSAQRIAFVDINTIMEKMPEYQNAQTEMDKLGSKWKQDIAQEYSKIEDMYRKYQAEQVLLSENDQRQREEAIVNKEKQVRKMQQEKFGPEGELFKKRQALVRPIQEKIYNAIGDYASDKGYDFIFDKSSTSNMLYSNPRYDKTEDILKKLNL